MLQSEPESSAGHMVWVESRHSDGEKHLFFLSFSFLFFSFLSSVPVDLLSWGGLLWIVLLSSSVLQQIFINLSLLGSQDDRKFNTDSHRNQFFRHVLFRCELLIGISAHGPVVCWTRIEPLHMSFFRSWKHLKVIVMISVSSPPLCATLRLNEPFISR